MLGCAEPINYNAYEVVCEAWPNVLKQKGLQKNNNMMLAEGFRMVKDYGKDVV